MTTSEERVKNRAALLKFYAETSGESVASFGYLTKTEQKGWIREYETSLAEESDQVTTSTDETWPWMTPPASKSRTITHAQLDGMIVNTFAAIQNLNETKGLEYAGHDDALANFHRRGAELDLDPLKVWGIFAGKHWDAILAYVRTGKTLSEDITGRIDDLILYAILLKGLIAERSPVEDPIGKCPECGTTAVEDDGYIVCTGHCDWRWKS